MSKFKYKIEVKWTLIFSSSILIWMILEKLFGLHDENIHLHQYLTIIFAIPAVIIYVLALKDKKDNFYSNKITYKQAFFSGLLITILLTVLSPINQWIISFVITPDYFNNVIDYTLETGYFKTIEEAKEQFNFKSYAIQSTIWTLLMGIITTAIVSIFIKSKSKGS